MSRNRISNFIKRVTLSLISSIKCLNGKLYFKVKNLSLPDEIQFLQFQIEQLPMEIRQTKEEIPKIIQNHMNLLHDYNEIKDIGQILIGKIAELKGTTSKEIYSEYSLNISD